LRFAAFLAGAAGAAAFLALRFAGLRFAAFLAGAAFLAALRLAGLRLAAFLAVLFLAVLFFAAGLRFAAFLRAGAFLAADLRAVVFLAATGPPRGKTLGLPEGSSSKGCQKHHMICTFIRTFLCSVSQKYFANIFEIFLIFFKKFHKITINFVLICPNFPLNQGNFLSPAVL
jgi:hypothetical protein